MIGYLALGSNMGDSLKNLTAARDQLDQLEGVTVLQSSKLYETDPYGPVAQDDFLNAVLQIECQLPAEMLLAEIHRIEAALGRTREIHWGPRTIDIDILLLGDLVMDTPQLTIPHKELTKRSFVLVPLQDVYPDENLLGRPLDEWITASGNRSEVRKSEKVW